MAHGKPIELDIARKRIRKFVDDEVTISKKPEKEIIVGHQFDLTLIKEFLSEIDKLLIQDVKIKSVRIYMAKSSRGSVVEGYDLIMVPTLENGDDYHQVYDRPKSLTMDPLILGESTPCPNVCDNKAISCK